MRVLVICSSFPPVNTSSVHRTVSLCRRLCERGHDVTVLTMPPAPGQSIDPSLSAKVPATIRIVRTRPLSVSNRSHPRKGREENPSPRDAAAKPCAPGIRRRITGRLRNWVSWWLHVPDSRTGWLIPAIASGLREARRSRTNVIYSTAPMWTAHLVGLSLGKLLHLPWVADCRDPWSANPFRCFPHRAHRRLDRWLEGRMVTRAAFVICNTEPARREFLTRYTNHAKKFVVVPNGYDDSEIDAIRRQPPPPSDGICRFVHTGSFYGKRSPFPLLRALRDLVRRRPDLRSKVRFRQIGLDSYEGQPLVELAQREGVSDMVQVEGPLPYAKALRCVHESQVAVVAGHRGAACELQIPRKLYEYLGIGKPILVTGGTCKPVRELLNGQRMEGMWLIDTERDSKRILSETIEQIVSLWETGRLPRQRPPDKDFSAGRMASRIEAVLIRARRARQRTFSKYPQTVEKQIC